MDIIVNETPIPASRPRVTRWATYYKEPYRSYKGFLRNLITQYARDHKCVMTEQYKPICMDIDFYMPIPKGTSKKKALAMEGNWHTKQKDKDNLIKSVYDSMNKILFYDDGQICDGRERKLYSKNPRTEVFIKEIE